MLIAKELLYSGKAKSIYATDDKTKVIMDFRDDISAFDGEKTEQLAGKGKVNNLFNAFIMQRLETAGIATHFEQQISDQQSVVKHLKMLPIECVVRNVAAGSLCRRLGVASGHSFTPALFEYFYKDDVLHDPMITTEHAVAFGWASEEQMQAMKRLSLQVNDVLVPLFQEKGLLLVDYKLEFGLFNGKLVLGDEFTPDGCRIWDAKTGQSLDKDRFRQGQGEVVETYQWVAKQFNVLV